MIKSKTDYPAWLTSAFSRKLYQVTKKKKKILSSTLEYRQGGNKAKNFDSTLQRCLSLIFTTTTHLGIKLPLQLSKLLDAQGPSKKRFANVFVLN